MAISPQRLTIYLYSAHRAVIFAIAQLSCSVIILRFVNSCDGQKRSFKGFEWLCQGYTQKNVL